MQAVGCLPDFFYYLPVPFHSLRSQWQTFGIGSHNGTERSQNSYLTKLSARLLVWFCVYTGQCVFIDADWFAWVKLPPAMMSKDHHIKYRSMNAGCYTSHPLFSKAWLLLWLPAWWALWLPWWPPAGCNNVLMHLLIFDMNFCYCLIVVFCWK